MNRRMTVAVTVKVVMAVLLGIAGGAAAESVGPTGQTYGQCATGWDACLDGCLESQRDCGAAGVSPHICYVAAHDCSGNCHSDFDGCKPSRAARKLLGLDNLVGRGDTKILASVAELSAKVDKPDLVALPAPASMPPQGFCRRNDQGQLLVKIYNQGGADAAATKTRVLFSNAVPADVDTPAVAAGSSTELVISIPNACFDASNNCSFTLGADGTEVAAESNETNNNAAGLCGPQFQ